MRRHIPLGVSALAVASMVVGFLAIAAPEASAQTNTWYVATTGSNTCNSCANQARPCRTISYALTEQAGSVTPGTIHVAAGTYTEQVSITTLNDNVKIQGAGSSTVIQPPSAGLLSDTDTDSSNPQYYVIDVAPGAVGVKLKKLSVNGLNGIPSLDADGNGCAQDYVGIYYHEASGSITDVSVNGIDMPANLFGCQGGQGIYVNSGGEPGHGDHEQGLAVDPGSGHHDHGRPAGWHLHERSACDHEAPSRLHVRSGHRERDGAECH